MGDLAARPVRGRGHPVARKLTTAQMELALDALKRAVLEGFIELQEMPTKRLYPEAQRLRQHHHRHQGELASTEAKA